MDYYSVTYVLVGRRFTRAVMFGHLEAELAALRETGATDMRIESVFVD